MKIKIYAFITLLALLLPAITTRGEEISGISDPFVFGTPTTAVPLSPWALVLAAGLIGLYIYRRYFSGRKQAA